MTPAIDHYCQLGFNPTPYLERHCYGDWGDLCDEDKETNRMAIKHGDRVMSSYEVSHAGELFKLWIITEADRQVTTLLLPSDY